MKRITFLLILCFILILHPVMAQDDLEEREGMLDTVLERGYEIQNTHLVVGNTTKVSGQFFTRFFGNNTSDIDVREMLYGYTPTTWDNQLQFVADPMVVSNLMKSTDGVNTTYTFYLLDDLVYNDGKTPITARDYVFAWALSASPEFQAISGEAPEVNVVGYEAFHTGESQSYAGIRLLNDYTFSVTIKQEFDPYFYELHQLEMFPYPISVIAPGCEVRDDGNGVYITGIDGDRSAFSAELLARTILDPETGYLSHPMLTAGPYRLISYDFESGVVEFEINPYYKGNYEGVKPVIERITLVPVLPEDMIDRLRSGEVNLLNKAVDASVINDGIMLVSEGDFAFENYPRMGYGFCAFSTEKNGPQQFQAVRQALNYAFDSDAFVEEILGPYGLPVYGYYGLAQWMYRAAAGNFRPDDLTEEEEDAWDEFSLDSLDPYDLDLDEARRLLIEDGWVLNENGEPFAEETDDIRYKQVGDELMPLVLKFAQCADNDAAQLVVDMFNETLPQIGAALDVEIVPFHELLMDYYRDDGQRKFDMNFMATNFVATFDPYLVFLQNNELQGSVNTSGIVDDELLDLAYEMRSTEPGDLYTFEECWIRMQERFNEVLPTMPIYSNIYFDFHSAYLTNYYPNAEYSWPVAILYASYEPPLEAGVEDQEEIFEQDQTDYDREAVMYNAPDQNNWQTVDDMLGTDQTMPDPAAVGMYTVVSGPEEVMVSSASSDSDGWFYQITD